MLINRLVTKYCYDIWYLLFPRVQDGGNSLKAHLVTDSLQLNKLTTLMQRNLTGESFLTTRSFFSFLFFSFGLVNSIILPDCHFDALCIDSRKWPRRSWARTSKQNIRKKIGDNKPGLVKQPVNKTIIIQSLNAILTTLGVRYQLELYMYI